MCVNGVNKIFKCCKPNERLVVLAANMSANQNLLPLRDFKVIELEAIGPVPFAALLLSQLGAHVTLVSSPRNSANGIPVGDDALLSGRHRIALDLKTPDGVAQLHGLLAEADALLEGFRPGTLERLGIGPDVLMPRHPHLVIGRCSGWGQSGSRAHTAGHDINYLALAGVLSAVGPAECPMPPLNLVGDFGGASMHLALGVVSAIHSARATGQGCIVGTSILASTLALTTHLHGLRRAGLWNDVRHDNLLDGGAPFYRSYATGDGQWVAVGAIEPKFFADLVRRLGVDIDTTRQYDRSYWPSIEAAFSRQFTTRTRDEWDVEFRGTDACVTPALNWSEVSANTGEVVAWRDEVPGCGIQFSTVAP